MDAQLIGSVQREDCRSILIELSLKRVNRSSGESYVRFVKAEVTVRVFLLDLEGQTDEVNISLGLLSWK